MSGLPVLSAPVFVPFSRTKKWVIPYGLAVRIPGFHPGGPGSTPGMGTFFLFFFLERRVEVG